MLPPVSFQDLCGLKEASKGITGLSLQDWVVPNTGSLVVTEIRTDYLLPQVPSCRLGLLALLQPLGCPEEGLGSSSSRTAL